jgi:hypothetical protein
VLRTSLATLATLATLRPLATLGSARSRFARPPTVFDPRGFLLATSSIAIHALRAVLEGPAGIESRQT